MDSTSRVSVALCTYNGERFIEQQLASIAQQTLPVDEVIIRDDGSTDDTVRRARQLALELGMPNVHISQNHEQLGVRRNFEAALRATTGEFVALCDQDDVWLPTKIQTLVEHLAQHPGVQLVYGDAELIDCEGASLGQSLFSANEITDAELSAVAIGDGFNVHLRRNLATGACVMIRRSLLDAALPIPDGWIHDEWLAIIADATSRTDVRRDKLTEYRQHESNAIGAETRSLRRLLQRATGSTGVTAEQKRDRAAQLAERLAALGDRVHPGALDLVLQKIAHESLRAELPRSRARRIPRILGEIRQGRYFTVGRGARSIAQDIVRPIPPIVVAPPLLTRRGDCLVQSNVAVVVPNWNGVEFIADCLDSLLAQTLPHTTIVVENGSTDGSAELLQRYIDEHPDHDVVVLRNEENLGFAGGVNVGIRWALANGHDQVALFNSDAIAAPDWLQTLHRAMSTHPDAGIVTGTLLHADGNTIDSTGDFYCTWGLAFPRDRDHQVGATDRPSGSVFSATGGASLFARAVFEQVGYFDEKFFAYYEDVDLGFRARLAGFDIWREAGATAYHRQGATSGKVPGFVMTQMFANLPMLFLKNVPAGWLPTIGPRFALLYALLFANQTRRGNFRPAIRGIGRAARLVPHALRERRRTAPSRSAHRATMWELVWRGLPPDLALAGYTRRKIAARLRR